MQKMQRMQNAERSPNPAHPVNPVQSAVGTMTTTLLLAYSGGYLTLLMVFAAQGTHPVDFLNSTLVSAELVKTLVGSFGLVLVAPFTALVSALLYGRLRDF